MPAARQTREGLRHTAISAVTALCVLFVCVPAIHAQDADRPLGILFPGVQPPPTDIRSPIVSLPSQKNETIPAASATQTQAAPSARPLGTLFNPASSNAQQSGSVLPNNWNAPLSKGMEPPEAQLPGTTTSSSDRPLGTLFNAPQRSATASGFGVLPARVEAQEIHPASRVQGRPAANATNEKPLGVLFGEQPADNIVAPSANNRMAQTAPAENTPAHKTKGKGLSQVPAELSADAMTFDRELGLIIATGNVEVVYGGRTLLADKITYNQKTDIVIADGNVSMTDVSGKVLLGDKMEITGDLKDGVIYNIGLVLEDKSRVAGAGARRTDGTRTEVSNAIYSPCNLCAENPSAAPLWQLKAVRVIHDSEKKLVTYKDAWLEIFGVPVAYTPYLSHPDPTVKRRSGFLAPSFSNSSDLGFRINTPYFWAIDDNQDATITPMLSTDGGQGATGQYRKYFKDGLIDSFGSFVGDDPDRGFRGYFKLKSQYHLNSTWRAGLDAEKASDDTFTRRYGFATEPVLVSRGYLEGFRGQSYQSINTYAFDDLRQDSDPGTSPIIAPMYDYNYVGKRDQLGGFSSFDLNALNLYRNSGTDTRRLAFRPRWDRPFNGPFGELYNASVSMAADAYHTSNVVRDDSTNYTGTSGRMVPRASLSWRLPLIRPGENFSQTIEPLASVVVAPNGGNPDKIPNEDIQEIEFDETNLFQDNRYDGFDRVDGGTRFNYGMNWVLTGNKEGSSSVFLGQSYRARVDNSFDQSSSSNDNFSDIVGRVQITPKRYLNLIYRTQFSPDNLSPQRNEVSATIGSPALRFNTDYIFINQQRGSEFSGREEINGTISSQINRNWSTAFSAREDLSASDLRSLGLNAIYEDECVKFTTRIARSFFEDRDLKPSDSITFTLVFKTLGEVHSGVSLSQ